MNDNRMKRQIQHSINTRLSGLQPDPWLAQRLLAGEEKNMDIKSLRIKSQVPNEEKLQTKEGQ